MESPSVDDYQPNMTTGGANQVNSEIISDNQVDLLINIVVFTVLPFNILGVITNSINIRVFIQQGILRDSSNIAFTFLAVYDLLTSATLIPNVLCRSLKTLVSTEVFRSCFVSTISLVYVHAAMQHCSMWTSVYISIVRCLCVVYPIRFTSVCTATLTLSVLFLIGILLNGLQCVLIQAMDVQWRYSSKLNRTLIQVFGTKKFDTYKRYKGILFNQVFIVLAIIITYTSMCILIRKLNQVKRWRIKHSSYVQTANEAYETSNQQPMATKEANVTKFVVTISTIFAVCASISFLPTAAIVLLPDVTPRGVNRNMYNILYLTRFIFNSINASINFFAYLRVSTRFKRAFKEAFGI